MGFLVKGLGALMLVVMLGAGLAIADLTLNQGSVVYAAMGRDELLADCRPGLASLVAGKGGLPDSVQMGETLALRRSTETGDEIKARFAFRAQSGAEYEGSFICQRQGNAIHIKFDAAPATAAPQETRV